MSSRLVPVLSAALMLAAGASGAAASDAPSLILFSGLGFKGRPLAYDAGSEQPVPAGFEARSAVSTGLWTLCEGRRAASRCQTVNGAAAELKLEPRIVRPGVDAIALYEKPGLLGRRVIYSFASDRAPPFRPHSAKTWGGPWTLCAGGQGRCETVDGARASLDLDVASVRPGRAPERLQLAAAVPPAPKSRTPAATAPRQIPLPPLPESHPQAAEPFARGAPPPSPRLAAQAAPPPRPRPAPPVQIDYACEDGRSLIVVFNPGGDTAEVLAEDGEPVVLDRAVARRGFRYQGWNRAFYGERGQATYEDRDREPVDCRAVQPRRAYADPWPGPEALARSGR